MIADSVDLILLCKWFMFKWLDYAYVYIWCIFASKMIWDLVIKYPTIYTSYSVVFIYNLSSSLLNFTLENQMTLKRTENRVLSLLVVIFKMMIQARTENSSRIMIFWSVHEYQGIICFAFSILTFYLTLHFFFSWHVFYH